MLVMGTSIGGGILALPIVGIGSGFFPTVGLILFLWALVVLSGLLFLELTLSFPAGENNFTSIAYKTFGHGGRIVTFISYLLLLYALVAAYIAGGGSLLSEIFHSHEYSYFPRILRSHLFDCFRKLCHPWNQGRRLCQSNLFQHQSSLSNPLITFINSLHRPIQYTAS